jgi:hypothetical protein
MLLLNVAVLLKLDKSNMVLIEIRKNKKLTKDTNPKYNQSRNEKEEKIEISQVKSLQKKSAEKNL